MRLELTEDAIGQITHADLNLQDAHDSQYWLRTYGYYAALPPLFCSMVGNAIVHPERKIWTYNLLDDALVDERSHNFSVVVWYPMLGYLIGYPLIICMKILLLATKHELSKNPNTSEKFAWNIRFVENKSVLPPFDSLLNALAIIFWSALYSSIYALIGNAVLNNVADQDSAVDIAKTYAVGGAVIPGIIVTLHLIYRIMQDGELSVCPNPNYWQATFQKPRLLSWCYDCEEQDKLKNLAEGTHYDRLPLLEDEASVSTCENNHFTQSNSISIISNNTPQPVDAVTAARAARLV